MSNVPTDKHPRIIVAEIAIRNINESLKQRTGFRPKLSKPALDNLMHELNSNVQQLKFSYLSHEELSKSEQCQKVKKLAEKLFDSIKESYHGRPEAGKIKKPSVYEAIIIWATKLLIRLPERFLEPFRPTIESGIDMQVVGIRNIVPIDNTKLFVSRVFNGESDFTVVTNIQTFKPGMRVGAAFLPPSIIGGEVSEAMFLGEKEYEEEKPFGTPIYDDADFGGVRNILKQEFLKLGKK